MGIRVSQKTERRATLKMYNALGSFLFEQQYDELFRASEEQMNSLRKAHKVLGELL